MDRWSWLSSVCKVPAWHIGGTCILHEHTHTHTHTCRQKHYLCISAPAMPLPPLPPSPGPGHYETQSPSSPERRLASGAVFRSTTSRWGGASNSQGPGPGGWGLPITASLFEVLDGSLKVGTRMHYDAPCFWLNLCEITTKFSKFW